MNKSPGPWRQRRTEDVKALKGGWAAKAELAEARAELEDEIANPKVERAEVKAGVVNAETSLRPEIASVETRRKAGTADTMAEGPTPGPSSPSGRWGRAMSRRS